MDLLQSGAVEALTSRRALAHLCVRGGLLDCAAGCAHHLVVAWCRPVTDLRCAAGHHALLYGALGGLQLALVLQIYCRVLQKLLCVLELLLLLL